MQRKTIVAPFFITAVLLGFAFVEGRACPCRTRLGHWSETARVIPMVTAAFLAAGLMKRLITPELVNQWLGQEAGWRGFPSVGWRFFDPGGPVRLLPYRPIPSPLRHRHGTLMAFVLGKQLSSLERLLMEFPYWDPA